MTKIDIFYFIIILLFSTRKMGRYAFDPNAQKTLDDLGNGTFFHPKPTSVFMTTLVDIQALFGERNPAGQTLLYCLLRFTKYSELRDQFLKAATPKQLAAKNSACGSTAIMGYFWGEVENPRMEGDTPVSDIILVLSSANAVKALQIKNNKGETALDFAKQIAKWRPDDLKKFQSLRPLRQATSV